jgi:hypothetical protein
MPAVNIPAVDRNYPLELPLQLDILQNRVSYHLVDSLGSEEAKQINQVRSAINDCSMVIAGIKAVVEEEGSRSYQSNELAGIAKRSFGVVHAFALDRKMGQFRSIDDPYKPVDFSLRKTSVYYGQMMVVPERLELIEKPIPFVKVRSSTSEPTYEEMRCPAFLGKSTGIPRLPKQLWQMVVDVYDECGSLEPSAPKPPTRTGRLASIKARFQGIAQIWR